MIIKIISIHATHTGGDTDGSLRSGAGGISIHATHTGGDDAFITCGNEARISIHATHTGGDRFIFAPFPPYAISIHATHTGGDAKDMASEAVTHLISIHATHTGGDASLPDREQGDGNFNPRHPYGWRPAIKGITASYEQFQSTPPIRVATWSWPAR